MAATKVISPRQCITALDRSMARIEFAMDGTIIDANRNFTDLMGYSLDEIRGRNHSMFVDEATRATAEYGDFWDRLRAGNFVDGEFRRVAKGGARSTSMPPTTPSSTSGASRLPW
jgi:methyl-accepting chemotaxis protein